MSNLLDFSERIVAMPIVHGSGDCALEVRRRLLAGRFDCVAAPIPPSFSSGVEEAILTLPIISAVVQSTEPSFDRHAEDSTPRVRATYVPVEPCQSVIAALRWAMEERVAREYIDWDTPHFTASTAIYPDSYALKQVSLEQFAAACVPGLKPPVDAATRRRCRHLGARLRQLEARYRRIAFVCSIQEWPWIRDAYRERVAAEIDEPGDEAVVWPVDPKRLLFFLAELPFVAGLYEAARATAESDENISIDGVKALYLAGRDRYRHEYGRQARTLSPKLFQSMLQYVRNLSLTGRRMTPSLYDLVLAAQQMGGDAFALSVTEAARDYPYVGEPDAPSVSPSLDQARFPDGGIGRWTNRLPGQSMQWRALSLKPRPERVDQAEWKMRWNPYSQCSWPPEDVAIETFRTHVKDAARALIGVDLARSEKFTSSMKDGLDLRETLRNWHTGDLYVRVLPPVRGSLDCVIMLFDTPADPRDYPWRVTWHAEHHDESTLALFATNFQETMVGPGIGQAVYGGAVFLFPPRPIPDVWRDRQLDFCETLEDRLIAAGCRHAHERHVALLSAAAPGIRWRQIAQRYGKKLVHLPLSRFSQEMIRRLRVVHVLNGTRVRSYAAHFIRNG